MAERTRRSDPVSMEAITRGIESAGIWIPLLVIVTVVPDYNMIVVLNVAFGSGTLAAAAALILLTFLASDGLTAQRAGIVFVLAGIAFVINGQMLADMVRSGGTNSFFPSPWNLWTSIIMFIGAAIARTWSLWKVERGWGLPE